ncbi:MAG: hypothetical protein EBU96_09645, partial [Actinobacteria bacterium]|nr:hypothetical protein [Actinomycetota bacterium]
MHLPVKKRYKHGSGAPRKFLSVVTIGLSFLALLPITAQTAEAAVGTTTGSTWISGTLTYPTDFYLTVTTGTSIELWTTGSGDPTLWLYDSAGNPVGYNDDSNGLMSYIYFASTNPNNGPYRVRAGRCCGNPDAGFSGTSYQLRINLTGSVSSTNNVSSIMWDDQSATTGSSGGSTSYNNGQPISTIPTTAPVRTGYTFGGWWTQVNGGGTQVTNGSYTPPSPYGTVTLYAKWTANTYTVTYNYNSATGGNGTASANFTTGGTAITLPTPTRTGYTFGGWYSDAGLTTSIGAAGAAYSPTGATTSLTAYAKWTANTYSVTIDPQGGGAVSTGLIGYWTFDDSSALGKNSVDGTSLSSAGATFTASGKNGGGLALNGGQYLSGTVANLPVGSSQYTIGGWMKTTSAGSQGILGWGTWGSGSRTNALRTNGNSGFYNYWWDNDLLGNYSIATNTWIYVIATYDGTTQRIYVNGTQIVSRTVSAPSVDNVNFRIGTTNNSEWFYGTLDDIVIYNRGLSASEISSLYSSAPTISSWIYGNTLTLPVAPTRSGYTFNGWYDAASGGTRLGTSSATYSTGSSALVLPTPTRTGYTFGGWYSDAGLTTSIGAAGANYTPTASLTAYAKWNGISNTVNFDAQGGAAVSSLLWTTGSSLTLPAAPTRAGYTFNGWYDSATGGTRVGSASASYTPANTGNFTLYAQWSANSNTVTFNTQGGSAVTSQAWTTGTSLTLPVAPTRAGFTFNGWYDAAIGGTRLGSGTVTRNGLDFDGTDDSV